MVLNLDKCIGCHTCSVTCKNVWTSRRDGVEYAWFNNVETEARDWLSKKEWKIRRNGRAVGSVMRPAKLGTEARRKIAHLGEHFANPNLPQIDDYYEPFTYDYERLQTRHCRRPADNASCLCHHWQEDG